MQYGTQRRQLAASRPQLPGLPSRRGSIGSDLSEPLTSFVAREAEIADLVLCLRELDTRLLTLTGPGGVGKTRLAIRVAHELAHVEKRTSVFVPLAPVTNPAAILDTIGRAIGFLGPEAPSRPDQLAERIGDDNLILVLDNFEQLVSEAPVLTRLLGRCRRLSMIVTSRTLLRVTGEREHQVRPLETPPPGASATQIDEFGAARLFFDRMATAGQRIPEKTDLASHQLVADICRQLDGLPLAIELAAAKTRLFSLGEMHTRLLSGTLALSEGPRDAPPRLQSMDAAVAWSYDMLDASEQRMFRLLCAFTGGFTIESAVGVHELLADAGHPSGDPVSTIGSLLEQSLIVRTLGVLGEPRFTILETIRAHGLVRLETAGEDESARKAIASWLSGNVRAGGVNWVFTPPFAEDDVLISEHDNLRSSVSWAIEHDFGRIAAQLTVGLWPFLSRNGHYTEARTTMRRVLETDRSLDPDLIAGLLLASSIASWRQSDFDASRDCATRALAICREQGIQAGIGSSLLQLGESVLASDPVRAVSLHRKALQIHRQTGSNDAIARSLEGLGGALMYLGDTSGASEAFTEFVRMAGETAELFNPLGWVALARGDLEKSETLLTTSLAKARPRGATYSEACLLRLMGRVDCLRGSFRSSAVSYQQALRLALSLGAYHEAGYCVAELAAVASAVGDHEVAARWLGFEARQRELRRVGLTPDETDVREHARALAVAEIGSDRFDSCFQEGQLLVPSFVWDEALRWKPNRNAKARNNVVLTPREREVLTHLAEHRTNKQIADSLFVGQRTIDTHVAHILAKLGVASRGDAIEAARFQGVLE